MICKACNSKDAYQPFLGPPECPNMGCEYFSLRRANEVNSGRKYTLKKLSTIDHMSAGDLVKVLWSVHPAGAKFNGLYKVISISLDSTNLVEAVSAKPTDQPITDQPYTFYREHLVEAFTHIEKIEEEEEKTPTFYIDWNSP